MNEPVDFSPYSGDVFRNFATNSHDEVTNDLVDNPRDQQILKRSFYKGEEGGIQSSAERVLRKSERQIVQTEISAKFNPKKWYPTRYSNGSWAVLYTAESENTALKEAMYHVRQFSKEELQIKPFIMIDRRVVQLTLNADCCIDLTQIKNLETDKLVSKDQSGYSYCQNLAKKMIDKGSELLRAPSARDPEGICVPVFNKTVIKKDHGPLKYIKCVLSKEGTRIFTEEKWIPLEPD